MPKTFVLSDESKVNSRGYRINLSGIDFNRFNNNPVMLYNHDHDNIIGRWENIRQEGGRLLADAVFDDEDAVAKEVSRKVEKGFIKGASLGLIPVTMNHRSSVPTLDACEIIEASIVSIPADAGAVALYDEHQGRMTLEQTLEFLNFNYMNQSLILSPQATASLGITGEITSASIDLALADKDAQISRLKDELASLQELQQSDFLAQAVKDGKISASELPSMQTLAKSNFDAVRTLLQSRSAQPAQSLAAMTQPSAGAQRADWNYLRWMKEDPKGLQRLKAENPTEFQRLQSTLS